MMFRKIYSLLPILLLLPIKGRAEQDALQLKQAVTQGLDAVKAFMKDKKLAPSTLMNPSNPWNKWSTLDINQLIFYLAKKQQEATITTLLEIQTIKQKFDPIQKIPGETRNPSRTFFDALFALYSKDSFKLLQNLVAKGLIKLNTQHGKIALMIAAKHQRSKIFKWLLDQNQIRWDNWLEEDSSTLLNSLVKNGMHNFIKMLDKKSLFKFTINEEKESELLESLLSIAGNFSTKDWIATLELLISKLGKKVLTTKKDLIKKKVKKLAECGDFTILRYLLERNYMPPHQWNNQQEVNELLRALAEGGQYAIFKHLFDHATINNLFNLKNANIGQSSFLVDTNSNSQKTFLDSFLISIPPTPEKSKGKLNILKLLINKDKVKLEKHRNTFNTLIVAKHGEFELAKYLFLQNDVKWDQEKANQLYRFTAQHGNLSMMKFLFNQSKIKKHFNINSQDQKGRTFIDYLTYPDYIDKRYNPSGYKTGWGNLKPEENPFPIQKEKSEILAFLIKEKKVYLKNKIGEKIFLACCASGNLFILLEHFTKTKIALTALNKKKQNGIMLAALNGQYLVIKILMQATDQLKINAQDLDGKTALMLAGETQQTKTIQKLIETYNADVNIKDEQGKTLLMIVAGRKNRNTVIERYLANTPIELLFFREETDLAIIQYLVEKAGARNDIKDNQGNTAYTIAKKLEKEKGNSQTIVKYLEKKQTIQAVPKKNQKKEKNKIDYLSRILDNINKYQSPKGKNNVPLKMIKESSISHDNTKQTTQGGNSNQALSINDNILSQPENNTKQTIQGSNSNEASSINDTIFPQPDKNTKQTIQQKKKDNTDPHTTSNTEFIVKVVVLSLIGVSILLGLSYYYIYYKSKKKAEIDK